MFFTTGSGENFSPPRYDGVRSWARDGCPNRFWSGLSTTGSPGPRPGMTGASGGGRRGSLRSLVMPRGTRAEQWRRVLASSGTAPCPGQSSRMAALAARASSPLVVPPPSASVPALGSGLAVCCGGSALRTSPHPRCRPKQAAVVVPKHRGEAAGWDTGGRRIECRPHVVAAPRVTSSPATGGPTSAVASAANRYERFRPRSLAHQV